MPVAAAGWTSLASKPSPNHFGETMHYVCQIRDNLLGQIDEIAHLEDAKALVLQIVEENGVKITDDVRQEVDNDLLYLGEGREWSVCIGIPTECR
jgi:hypothetical protein